VVCLWSPYGWSTSTVRCCFVELVTIPYGRRYPKCCTPARGLNREVMQMGTDDTKGYSGGSDIVLLWSFHRRSHRACYKFECLGLWEFVVKNSCKMSDCSSPVKRTLKSMHAHAFNLNTNPSFLLPSNVRSPKKRKKHWNFLNYEALIDQQFLTEIEHLIARLQGN